MIVGNRIKELRTNKSLSVNKLANLAGISQSYLRDIELGNKNPTVETLSLICDVLGVTLESFFSQTETDNIINDSLKSKINKLSHKQRDALELFLESIVDKEF